MDCVCRRLQLFAFLFSVFSLFLPLHSNAIDCYNCHGSNSPPDYRPIDSPTRDIVSGGFNGSHRKHMDAAATQTVCSLCHPGSENYEPSHRNGLISVSLDTLYPAVYRNGSTLFPQNPTPKLGICRDVSCHSDGTSVATGVLAAPGTPVWGLIGQSCSACHGNPPSYASGSPKVNSHQKHLFSCNRCHYSTTTNGADITTPSNHRNKYYNLSGPSGETFSYAGVRQCYNSYCHGNGTNVATGATVNSNTTPSWGSSGPLPCSNCHANPPAYAKGSPKSNLHLIHNSYGYKCSQCHYATTQNGTTIVAGSTIHANHAYDISGPPDRPVAYSYAPTGGTCANTYCHSSGQGIANPADPPTYTTPNWSQKYPVRCWMCHKFGYHAYDSKLMNTGSHFKHLKFDSTLTTCVMCHYTPKYGSGGCFECHNPGTTQISSGVYTDFSPRGPEHANGVIDVAFLPNFPAAGSTASYSGDSLPGTAYGVCANFYCHSQGTKAVPPYSPANIPVVTWGGAPMPVDCTGCHGGDLNSSIPMATLSHGKHLGFDCARCHLYTVYNSRNAIPSRPASGYYSLGSYHSNGGVEVSFQNSTTAVNGKYAGQTTTINRLAGTAPGRCNSVYCHTNGTAVVSKAVYGNISTPIWGTSGRLNCGSCHGNPPGYPDGDPKGNGHLKHNSDCKNCHYTVTINNTAIADKTRHAQFKYDVSAAPGITINYTFALNGSSCSAVSCHSNGGAVRDWGVSCIHCHGNPPAYPNYNPKANSHLGNHALLGCQNCHYSVTTTGKTISNPALHNNGRYNVVPGPGVIFLNTTGNTRRCSNVSCHNDGTAVATGVLQSSGSYAYANWGSTLDCTGCHGDNGYGPDYPNGSPKANSHQKHKVSGCYQCHYSVMNGGDISNPALHKNGLYNVTPWAGILGFTYTYATNADHSLGGTCTALYCHSNATSVVTGAAVTASASWGGPSLGCTSCHGNPPSYPTGSPKTNGHMGKHLPYSCDRCHSYYPSGHANAYYDINGGVGVKMTYASGYYASCRNVSCHGDGTSISTGIAPVNASLQWGGTATFTCGGCHALPPAYPDRIPKTNAHSSHTGYGCQVCHYAVTTSGTTIDDASNHANGTYDIASDGSANFDFAYGFLGSSCSNISCHAEGAKRRNWTYQPLDLRSVSPVENAASVDVNYPVQLVFAEEIDLTTVNGSTFALMENGSPVVGVYSAYTSAQNYYVISFTPNQPLKYYTTYTVTFTNEIKTAVGLNITSGKSWNFTTGHSPGMVTLVSQSFPYVTLSPLTVPTGSWGIDNTSLSSMYGYYARSMESWGADSVLQSPPIDMSGYQSAELRFNYNLKYSTPNTADVDISVNGDSGPWINVWSRSTPSVSPSTEAGIQTLNLSSIMKGQATVMFRFRLHRSQISADPGWFGVDEIYLFADPN